MYFDRFLIVLDSFGHRSLRLFFSQMDFFLLLVPNQNDELLVPFAFLEFLGVFLRAFFDSYNFFQPPSVQDANKEYI